MESEGVYIKQEINEWDEDENNEVTNSTLPTVLMKNTDSVNIKVEINDYNEQETNDNEVRNITDQYKVREMGTQDNVITIRPAEFVAVKEEFTLEDDAPKEPGNFENNSSIQFAEDKEDAASRLDTRPIKPQSDLKKPFRDKSYECDTCLNWFVSLSGLNKHKRTHATMGQKPFRCHNCPACFSTLKELTAHGNVEHPTDRPFVCDGCGKGFKKVGKLNAHRRVHTGERRYVCDICGRAFGELGTLKAHRRTHTGEKPFVCAHCNRGFTTISKLRVHERTHTGYKPYKCDECDRSFAQLDNLNSHKMTHSGERPYECPTCKKKLRTRSNFNVHIRTHTGERPYVCTICYKVFAEIGSLKVHKRVHSGERPYECQVCKKRFAVNSQWNVHMRIHTGVKPYGCTICGKRFTQLGHMNAHKRVHENTGSAFNGKDTTPDPLHANSANVTNEENFPRTITARLYDGNSSNIEIRHISEGANNLQFRNNAEKKTKEIENESEGRTFMEPVNLSKKNEEGEENRTRFLNTSSS